MLKRQFLTFGPDLSRLENSSSILATRSLLIVRRSSESLGCHHIKTTPFHDCLAHRERCQTSKHGKRQEARIRNHLNKMKNEHSRITFSAFLSTNMLDGSSRHISEARFSARDLRHAVAIASVGSGILPILGGDVALTLEGYGGGAVNVAKYAKTNEIIGVALLTWSAHFRKEAVLQFEELFLSLYPHRKPRHGITEMQRHPEQIVILPPRLWKNTNRAEADFAESMLQLIGLGALLHHNASGRGWRARGPSILMKSDPLGERPSRN